MAFKNLRLSCKMMLGRVRRYVKSGSYGKKKKKKQSWMIPAVSHGYHVIQEIDNNNSSLVETDKVVAQREETEEHELWFFGVFDSRTGDGVSHYMQTHLFDENKLKETQMRSKSKETMRKAHMNARAKVRETEDDDERWELGSATAVVIDSDKIVVADMGEYKVVVCRDGKAYQINRRLQQNQQTLRRHWCRKFISGAFRKVKVRFTGRDSGYTRAAKASKERSEVAVGYERIDRDTEFVILGSIGIWEVMKHQEAVHLIRHIEDPQEAAECLAKEALIRMTKKNISCLIIRFLTE